MEALRRRRGLGRSPRPRRTEGALEEARGLSGQLRQLTLQYFELGSCIVGGAAREQEVHQLEPRRDVRRSAGDYLAQVALLASPLPRVGRAPGELGGSVQRSDVGGIAAQYALDLAARLRLPPGQLVYLGKHQPDIAVGRIERRRATELGLGLAVAAFSQVDEPEIGIAHGLVGGKLDDLLELRFGLW